MSWFTRKDKGILTPTESKREAPDGLWYQCPSCKKAMHTREHRLLAYTCSNCGYHEKIGSQEYFELLFDDNRNSNTYKPTNDVHECALLFCKMDTDKIGRAHV